MAATGKTKNYGLPIFQPKDGTGWESFNRAMVMLDTVIANVAAESGGGGASPEPELEEKVSQNTADIGTLQQRVSNHDYDISELKLDQSTTSQGVEKNASNITELKTKDSELDTTIAGMQAKVDSNELGVQTLTSDYAKLEDKVEENTTDITSIKSRQEIDAESIQWLMTNLGKTDQNVKNLTSNQTELSKDVETLTSTADLLESDLESLSEQVERNKTNVISLQNSTSAMAQDILDHTEQLKMLANADAELSNTQKEQGTEVTALTERITNLEGSVGQDQTKLIYKLNGELLNVNIEPGYSAGNNFGSNFTGSLQYKNASFLQIYREPIAGTMTNIAFQLISGMIYYDSVKNVELSESTRIICSLKTLNTNNTNRIGTANLIITTTDSPYVLSFPGVANLSPNSTSGFSIVCYFDTSKHVGAISNTSKIYISFLMQKM